MKIRSLLPLFVLCLGMCLGTPGPSARAEAQVSFSFFYDNLSPYGEWVTVGDYGSAWHPRQVDNEWSPYQDGSWVYTDDGWTWVSDEPWADVTYHYGRWVDVDGYGWCWVPGYEWAPAWVSWRSSDDYIGWAPLPPEAVWQPSIGFSIWTDSYYDIGPRYYRFCRVQDFCEPNLRHVYRPWHENISLMSVTYNITNINYDNDRHRVFNGGPHLSFLRDRTSSPVRRLRLIEEDRYQRSSVRGDEFRIFRPRVNLDEGRDRVRNSIARTFDRSKIDHGWRSAGNDDERRDLRSRVQDQVRGLNPKNAPAAVVSATAGGLSAREFHEKRGDRFDDNTSGREASGDPRKSKGKAGDQSRVGQGETKRWFGDPRGEGKGNDRPRGVDDKTDTARGPEKPKTPMEPRKPGVTGDDREDIRRGVPVPTKKNRDDDNAAKNKGLPVVPPTDRRRDDNNPAKNNDKEKNEGTSRPPMTPKVVVPKDNAPPTRETPVPPTVDRRRDDGRPDARKGLPVPPTTDRRRDDDSPAKKNDRDKNEGTSRPPMTPAPKVVVPRDNAPTKREQPDRPVMPKKPEAPKIERREPQPQVNIPTPKKEAPRVERSAPPQVKKQEPQARPQMPKRQEAPQVERRAPTPAPKPQASPNRGGDDDKKKKKDKDDR